MSLDYVSPGEGVKASTVNSLIEAVQGGGNMSPDLIVTGTRSGPQLVAPARTGSTDLRRDQIFDVENYLLSGWPMAKLKLGFRLQDALGAVNVHADGETLSATSAVVLFKNSAGCPFSGGSVSSYVLGDDDFGKRAAYGDTGWVDTKMEGLHGETEPSLEVWRTDDNVLEVFVNLESGEIQQNLSAALRTAGMEDSELSTMRRLGGWKLASQTKLQAGGKNVATGRMAVKNGPVDVYDFDDQKPRRAMLKAYLVCYDASPGLSGGRDSDWTWMIPLGPGAEYDDDAEGVWTTQLAYGGDPIVVKAEEGELDQNFDGEPTWIEESEFGDGCVAFGKFHSDGGDEIDPGVVWMDLEYDYQKFAVLANISDGSSDPPESNGLQGASIRIANAKPFTPEAGVQKGDEADQHYIFQGTLGDLFKGEPKLDSTTPHSSQSRFSSLSWTERGKEQEGGGWQGGVPCHCLQLYGFDSAEESQPTSADLYVARRFDSETSSATLVYIPLSSMGDVPPDSEISDAQTSSLQWKYVMAHTSSDEDPETSSETSSDTKVLQAWNFDNLSAVYNDLCIALSGQQQHVMLRNCETSAVEYLQLSCLSVLTDSQGMTDQKSIDWLSSDTMAPLELQLYGFDVGEADAPASSDLYLARRATETGPRLAYIPLSTLGDVPPDSEISNSGLSSIQFVSVPEPPPPEGEEGGETPSSDARALALFNFGETEQFYASVSAAQESAQQHVVLRNASLSAVEYMALSALSVMADSQGMLGQKSVSWLSSDGAAPQLLQLWNFDQEGEADVSVGIGPEPAGLLSDDCEFVIRKGGAGGELQYVKVKAAAVASTADSQLEDAQTSSVEYREVSSEGGETSGFFQVWEFDHFDKRWWELSDALSGANRDVLLRDCETSSVCYIALSALSSQPATVDSDGQSGQKSVSWLSSEGDEPRLQLYKMDEAGEELSDVTLSARPQGLLPDDYEFVVRKNGAGGEISYAKFRMASMGSAADGDDEEARTSSVQTRELSSEDGVSSVMQIWEFDHFDKRWAMLSDALSGENKDVLLRDCGTSSVCYLSLSALSSTTLCVDSEYGGQMAEMKSVQFGTYSDDEQKWLQLYGFASDPAAGDSLSVTLSSGAQGLLPEGCEFLVRTTGSGGARTLEYKTLSAAVALGEAAVDSMFPEAQTSSLETRTVSSEGHVSSFAQLWNFEHMDQRWYQLSDALSGALRDVVLRDTETSSVRYIALSALSAGGVHPDAEGESGQKSIDWLSGTEPPEIQLYGMDEDGETLSNVVLGETAVSLLPEDYEFVVRKNGKGGEIGYATVNASGLSSASSRFQFSLAFNGTTAAIGEGAVQIGGYTYFSNGGSVYGAGTGTWWICVRCQLGQELVIGFEKYATTQSINYEQGDLTKYIFPLYKVSDGEVLVDYRPMPNAGCWEMSENYNQPQTQQNGGE